MSASRTGMDLAFLARVRKMSIITGAIVSVAVATYWGISVGAAWLAGTAWSLINLFFIGEVIKNVITAEDRQLTRILVVVVIKFPVLYAVGFLLLWSKQLPVLGLVAGFTWPFLVMILKAIGRAYLHMDDRRMDEGTNGEGKPSQA
jgi:hypothetical protein